MNKNKFSIIEMMVVLAIIALLMTIAFPYIRTAQENQKKVTTRNMLNQYKAMVSAYYTDYGLLPTPGHVNPNTFNDATASVDYWRRIPKGMFPVNKLPAGATKNAELYFDYYDFEEGSLKTIADFNLKFPVRDLLIPLESWYNGATTPALQEKEQLSVLAHSSKFLNFYMSGSGFDMVKDGSYNKAESKWLANYDTCFRLGSERSAMVKLQLYFATNDTIFWNGGSPEVKLTTIPPVTSWVFGRSLVYFDYIPKILGAWNAQVYSKNLAEDKLRRIYDFHEDKNPDGTNKQLPVLADKYAPKKITLGSDRIIFNSNFFGSSSLNDARAQKTAAETQTTNAAAQTAAAAAQLAAAVTPAQITAANNAVAAAATATANAVAANTAADLALKNAKPGDLNNSNTTVYMRAHVDNVKNIVDAFNSPIVYITHVNQRKESARTFKYIDSASGVADPKKDKSLSTESFVLYSLGVNKADDSNLGENYFDKLKTGDDIIEMSGGK